MRAVFVHGFNVKDGGANTVDKLAPFADAAGWYTDIDEADYGYFNLFMVKWTKSKTRARVLYRLAKAFENADIIITHSNGANFATQALDMLGSEFNNSKIVVHISPALDRDTPIPQAVKSQLVMHTPHDVWVRLSTYLPFMPWGRMGAFGYSGNDKRNTNEKHKEIPQHSEWFNDQFIENPTWKTVHLYGTENK